MKTSLLVILALLVALRALSNDAFSVQGNLKYSLINPATAGFEPNIEANFTLKFSSCLWSIETSAVGYDIKTIDVFDGTNTWSMHWEMLHGKPEGVACIICKDNYPSELNFHAAPIWFFYAARCFYANAPGGGLTRDVFANNSVDKLRLIKTDLKTNDFGFVDGIQLYKEYPGLDILGNGSPSGYPYVKTFIFSRTNLGSSSIPLSASVSIWGPFYENGRFRNMALSHYDINVTNVSLADTGTEWSFSRPKINGPVTVSDYRELEHLGTNGWATVQLDDFEELDASSGSISNAIIQNWNSLNRQGNVKANDSRFEKNLAVGLVVARRRGRSI